MIWVLIKFQIIFVFAHQLFFKFKKIARKFCEASQDDRIGPGCKMNQQVLNSFRLEKIPACIDSSRAVIV